MLPHALSQCHSQRPPASPFFRPRSPSSSIAAAEATSNRGSSSSNVTIIKEHKSGIVGCTANLTTCIVGSGIVGLPYAFSQTGLGAGILLLTCAAVLTETSLQLLVATAKHVHKQSYETVAEVPLGIWGFRFVLVNMFVIAYGAMVSYLMITKTCASLLLGVPDDDMTTQNMVLLILSFCIQLPLACRRDMAALERTSTMAVLFDCMIVVMVACVAPWWTLEGLPQTRGQWTSLLQTDLVHGSSLFAGLGVLSFALECQDAVFLIAGSLERPTVHRWGIVTKTTLFCCWVLALFCAMTGYLGYGSATQGNILNNFPVGRISYAAHIMLGSTMLATYPLASFVARHVCIVLLFEGPRAHEGGDDSLFLQRPDRRFILTLALYVTALIPATLCTDIGRVLALAGVIGGSSLAYIGPGLLHLAVHGGRFMDLTQTFFVGMERNQVENGHIRGDEEVPATAAPSSSKTMTTTPTTMAASEHTSLLSHSPNTGNTPDPKSAEIEIILMTELDCVWWKRILWYAGGFPLWSRIAVIGHRGILAYAQQTVTKNTTTKAGHSRIGDVDHSALHKLFLQKQSSAVNYHHSNLPFIRSFSDTKPGTSSLLTPTLTAFLDATTTNTPTPPNPTTTSITTTPSFPQKAKPALEPDPQERLQTWWDFVLSLFFICFGIIALVAGLISLSVSSASDDAE